MIRINLLPVREWKKRESVRKQISIFFLSLVLLLVGLLAVGSTIQGKVMMQRQELKSLEEQKKKLAYVNRKINAVKSKTKEVENKFSSIEKLQQGRIFTVQALDEIVTSLPLNRLWITSLQFNGGNMNLSGVALDNHTVALFMKRLDASAMCSRVKLKNSNLKKVQGHDLMQFSLSLTVTPLEKKDKPETGKK